MNYWKNTNTLDDLVPELQQTVAPAEAEIAVIGSKPIDLAQFPRLKGLFKCGVGTDNVPFEACARRNITVGLPSAVTADIIYEETANFAIHLILGMLYADAGDLDAWIKHPRPLLRRRSVLVVGMGNIGRRVSAKLSPMADVAGYDVTSHAAGELEPLVRRSEVVSLHVPLTDDTRNWFNAEKLAWMRDGAALVNTARAAIVPEADLLKEVAGGRLRAAFDVFWQEPYYGPLRSYHPRRFCMTPHIASTCDDFLSGLASDLRAFAAGSRDA